MFCFIQIRRNQTVVFYWILVYTFTVTVQMERYLSRNIQCYTCSGGQECGITFSPSMNNNSKHLSRLADELLYSCSINVNSEGITTRDLVLSSTCRSSAYQFCCKENLCNFLPSPPLPAFTNLTCIVGRCSAPPDYNICDDNHHIAFRSSATESCWLTKEPYGNYIYKSYRKGCFPALTDILIGPMESENLWFTNQSFCCNTPECNRQQLPNGVAIRCYVCDSRVTGLAGCSILNVSNPNVYKSGSSSSSEECAMIVGLAGQDATSNTSYPAFTIRTYIANCSSQPLGHVSYGGASFQGRLSCCRTNYCNTEPLDIYLTSAITTTNITTAIKTTIKETTATTTTAEVIKTTTTVSITRGIKTTVTTTKTTAKVMKTTTTTTITTALKTTMTRTTVTIKRTTKNAGIKAETRTATESRSNFRVSKTTKIILSVVIICGLAMVILLIVRQLNCRKPHRRQCRHSFRNLCEEIPLASPLDPSTLPFIQIITEL